MHSIPLWPNGAPGALGNAGSDIPTITPYIPEANLFTGSAFIVLPGGGYEMLAAHEGENYARFLAQNGITAFVLKYRLGSDGYRHPRMLEDAARAVRLVRTHAKDWHIDAQRVGVIGSSAGGHLAATLATHFDLGNPDAADPIQRASSRPDAVALCYPVISLGSFTHLGSKEALLGKSPSEALIHDLSNEHQVTPGTPPCFLWHTWEDLAVPVENSLMFAEALRRAGIPFDLHIYERGAHGMGLGDTPPFGHPHPWAAQLLFWLRARGFLQR